MGALPHLTLWQLGEHEESHSLPRRLIRALRWGRRRLEPKGQTREGVIQLAIKDWGGENLTNLLAGTRQFLTGCAMLLQ